MKLLSILALLVSAFGCSSEEAGTTVSGSVELTRSSGAETGQTGFVFPDRTLLEMNPFYGSCTIDDTPEGTRVGVYIERVNPDPFGLASITLDLPVARDVDAGSAKVSAVAGGTTFADASGSCELAWGRFDESVGRVDLQLDCGAMTGGTAAETVSFSADLLIDGCE